MSEQQQKQKQKKKTKKKKKKQLSQRLEVRISRVQDDLLDHVSNVYELSKSELYRRALNDYLRRLELKIPDELKKQFSINRNKERIDENKRERYLIHQYLDAKMFFTIARELLQGNHQKKRRDKSERQIEHENALLYASDDVLTEQILRNKQIMAECKPYVNDNDEDIEVDETLQQHIMKNRHFENILKGWKELSDTAKATHLQNARQHPTLHYAKELLKLYGEHV